MAKSRTSGAKVLERHAQHVKNRKEQLERAYLNRVAKWKNGMDKEGVSKDVQEKLIGMYNRDVAKLGKPPRVKMSEKKRAYFDPKLNEIVLNKDSSSWHGHSFTGEHELGHWLDYNTRFRKNLSSAAQDDYAYGLRNAAQKDWDTLKRKYNGKLDYFNVHKSNNYFNDLSRKIFGNSYPTKMEESKIKNSYMDVIGSMTNGRYGFGHKKNYYKRDIGMKEVFTHGVGAIRRKDSVFRLEFPNTWDYINSITKGLYK